jgi:hypothetical protein
MSEFTEADITFYAVDNCDEFVSGSAPLASSDASAQLPLSPQSPLTVLPQTSAQSVLPPLSPLSPGVDCHYQSLDIMDIVQRGLNINSLLAAPLCDLSVSFGFLHHVPLQEYRVGILTSLINQTRPGGYVIVSLWQFHNNATMKDKAQTAHERALHELGKSVELSPDGFDDNDYLLGWQNTPGAYRYCHSFSANEIDHLIESVASKATVVSRFTADGKTNDLNSYLILKVN